MNQQQIFNNMGAVLNAAFATVITEIDAVFAAAITQTTTRHLVFTKADVALERKLVVVCTNEGEPGVDGTRSIDATVMYNAVGEPKLGQFRATYDSASGIVTPGQWTFRAEIPDMAECLFFVESLVGHFTGNTFTGLVDHQTTVDK